MAGLGPGMSGELPPMSMLAFWCHTCAFHPEHGPGRHGGHEVCLNARGISRRQKCWPGLAPATNSTWLVVGCIVDGIADYFWLIPPDIIKKNANLGATGTLTADMLNDVVTVLKLRGVPLN